LLVLFAGEDKVTAKQCSPPWQGTVVSGLKDALVLHQEAELLRGGGLSAQAIDVYHGLLPVGRVLSWQRKGSVVARRRGVNGGVERGNASHKRILQAQGMKSGDSGAGTGADEGEDGSLYVGPSCGRGVSVVGEPGLGPSSNGDRWR
jgi:hypothetical protein